VKRTPDRAEAIHREELNDRFQEIRVLHEAVLRELLPHEALSDAAPIHRDDVEHHAEKSDPEMPVGELGGVESGVVEAREQPIKHAEREESVPTERPSVD